MITAGRTFMTCYAGAYRNPEAKQGCRLMNHDSAIADPLRATIRDVSPEWDFVHRWIMRARKHFVIRGLSFREFIQRRCLFVHVPKAAGISVAHSLFGHRGGAHLTMRHYRVLFETLLGVKDFDQYYKFSFVRNPWDRVFSSYTFLLAGGLLPQDQRYANASVRQYSSFHDFVLNWLTPENIRKIPHFRMQLYYLVDEQHRLAMDYVGRFETLKADYAHVRQVLGFGGELTKMNVTKRKRKKYTDAYDTETIEHVARVYAEDIERLGYSYNSYDKSPVQTA
ncbi:MAG: sulfotransferase family 2 domain-containing protein [Phycisphaeraceae bacterium]|nr:sulfotransferase family 2 domain-containing protein [Phycisphaeraceae bacterium]